MPNTNSIGGYVGSGSIRNTWPTQTVASTTETILTLNTDTGTANAFLVLPSGGQVYGAQVGLDVNSNAAIIDRSAREYGLPSGENNDQFSSASWDGHPFKVRIAGIGNAGAAAGQAVQVNLYQGTSTTIASDHLVGSTGTALAAVAGGPFQFLIEASLLWDATSQIISGWYQSTIAFAATSQVGTPTAITSITGITAPNLSFLATLKLSNAASSTITVREMVFDKV